MNWSMEPLHLLVVSIVYLVLILLFAEEPLGYDLWRRFRKGG